MHTVLLTRRHMPLRARLVIALVASITCLGAWSAGANAATTGDVSSFSLTPSSLQAAGNPSITSVIGFSYGSSTTDSVKNLAVTLPPGLLAAPSALSATCSPAQLSSYTCPAGSQIGTATGTTTLGALSATLYLMPTTSTADVANLGVVLSAPSGSSPYAVAPVASASGPVYFTASSTLQPELVLSVDNLPDSLTVSGQAIPFQLTQLSVTINGTSSSNLPLTRMPSLCSAASAGVSVDTYSATADGSATSAPFTPTGCATLPYAPKLSAAGLKDASDNGVAITTVITQAANEATSSKLTLTIPGNVSPNLTAAVGLICSSPNATFSNCTPVGTAAATSSLLPTPLAGEVYLTGTISPVAPKLTVVFPPPFALELNGAIGISTDNVSFTGVPDVPLTALKVALSGGANSLFTTTCNPTTANATAAFTDQNGDLSATSVAPLAVSGCTTSTPPPPVKKVLPKLRSASLGGLATGKPKLKFTGSAGTGGTKIASAGVKLSSGLSFVKSGLKKGIVAKGAKIKSESIKGGKLTLTFKSAVSSFTVTISAPAVKASKGLVTQAKKKKVKSLKVTFYLTNTAKTTTVSPTVFKF